jgi:cytoskeletal protein CcmA (bactofilin family)
MFSKKPESTPRQSASVTTSGPSFSVLGPDVVVNGDLTAQMDLHIDGRVNGDISCATLVLGEGSQVTGIVSAENARVAGTIKGSISAAAVVIQRTARIEGDVTYGALTVEEGAQVDGKFTHRLTEPKLMLAGGTEAI